jgi:hypothetical protein
MRVIVSDGTVLTGVELVNDGKMTGMDVSVGNNVWVFVKVIISGVGDDVDIVAGRVGGMRELSQLIRG